MKEKQMGVVPVDRSHQSEQIPEKLDSFDEIYRTAGIKAPHSGYTVLKVTNQLLASEHLRGQSPDVKRCAVLVALETAGVDVDDVAQDAVQRERALNAYESVQQKTIEEFEARKAKENREIQMELERKTAELNALIQANLSLVAKEKDRFRAWQSRKQQEIARMMDTVELCMRKPAAAPPHSTLVLELPSESSASFEPRRAVQQR